MNELTSQQKQLTEGWHSVYQGAAGALEWVREVRATAPRLNDAAGDINLVLHRSRNLARDLGRVAQTPMTMGFFGLSQAGKSYLISALAAGTNGKLETLYGEQKLDFIEHINPVGGGKEATGLVTRFSRSAKSGPVAFPVELKLFNEIELAKILANAWFNDFNHEKVSYELTEDRIHASLTRAEAALGQTQSGVTADDVVSLWDYLKDNFKKSVGKLDPLYWPRVLELAPRLTCQQRAELFSLLWGEQPELTHVYTQLAATLQRLGGCPRVYAPLAALVKPDGDGLSQQDSIMNVDMLERLDSSRDLLLEVCPADSEPGSPVSISLAQLAVLTAELTFPLVNPTQDSQVEKVDLLDFPGYRGRLSIESVTEAGSQTSSEDGNPVSQLLLRGKVAYLFERYTDSQEMNCLVVCTSSAKQSDVTSVGPVLTRWIEKTQGRSPKERSRRAPGLIWALTMCDMAITNALNRSESQLREGWDGLIKMTMQERFGQYEWMQNWAGEAFNNTYLVRKPRMDVAFIDLEPSSGDEVAIGERYQEKLALMASTFADSASVQQHVAQPAEAWQAMLAMNEGGIQRISGYLDKVANIDFKLQRIEEQLLECREQILHSLAGWYEKDGEGALAKQKAQAQLMLQALGSKTRALGEILHYLQLNDDTIRELYLSGSFEELSADEQEATETALAETAVSPYADDDGFNFNELFDEQPAVQTASAPGPELQTYEHKFARAVFQAWVCHLRELGNRQALLNMLGLERRAAEALADELITAAYRHELPEKLAKAAIKRAQSNARREQLVQGQVLSAQVVMGDFTAWLSELEKEQASRNRQLMGSKSPLFSFYSEPAPGELPTLPSRAVNQAKVFLGDWLSGLYHNTLENAGHSAGREITLEQNTWLGQVLEPFSDENLA